MKATGNQQARHEKGGEAASATLDASGTAAAPVALQRVVAGLLANVEASPDALLIVADALREAELLIQERGRNGQGVAHV